MINKLSIRPIISLILGFAVLISVAVPFAAAKARRDDQEKRVNPVPEPSNATCASLRAQGKIVTFNSLKLVVKPQSPPTDNQTLTTALVNNTQSYGTWTYTSAGNVTDLTTTLAMEAASVSSVSLNAVNFSLFNGPGKNHVIEGVLVCDAHGCNFYKYGLAMLVRNDGSLITPDGHAWTLVEYCMGPNGSTAATEAISGRVVDSLGLPIFQALVTARNASTGEPLSARTNPDGTFTIANLDQDLHIVTVQHKRYVFDQNNVVINVGMDSASEIVFQGRLWIRETKR